MTMLSLLFSPTCCAGTKQVQDALKGGKGGGSYFPLIAAQVHHLTTAPLSLSQPVLHITNAHSVARNASVVLLHDVAAMPACSSSSHRHHQQSSIAYCGFALHSQSFDLAVQVAHTGHGKFL